jgi:RimJ/RimL family protein N-acetyltransferase
MSTLLETERLRLERWTEAAVDELVLLHSDADVQRYLDIEARGWSREKAAGRLAEWEAEFAAYGLGKHRLVRREDGAFVGRAGFGRDGEVAEIGYSMVRGHWGKGYATEIARALSDWFFAGRPDTSFIGFAHSENAASRAVLEKIGMQPTHTAEIASMPHQFYEKQRPRA